ncbi:MAG: hypothetical protein IPG39_21480 [Bacteroidetes bacterium]|nr:hypothetical protein [Bacteroidota bacterium]
MKNAKGIRIIPISLDEDKSALEQAIKSCNCLGRLLSITNGVARSAKILIFVNPTMLLLDEQNKILAKPMDVK